MKGVDVADQYLSHYSMLRKTIKWYKKLSFWLINASLMNAFLTHQRTNSSTIKYKDFLLEIANEWIQLVPDNDEMDVDQESTSVMRSQRAPRLDPAIRLSGNLKEHILEKIVSTGKYPRRKCRVCSSHNIRKDTRYICKTCKVPLHVGECFNIYHTK